jgi:aerobic carbon-monoxide dehydrogenase small subunit
MQVTVTVNGKQVAAEDEVRIALEGNLGRCTGYHNIVRAVLAAAGEGATSDGSRA